MSDDTMVVNQEPGTATAPADPTASPQGASNPQGGVKEPSGGPPALISYDRFQAKVAEFNGIREQNQRLEQEIAQLRSAQQQQAPVFEALRGAFHPPEQDAPGNPWFPGDPMADDVHKHQAEVNKTLAQVQNELAALRDERNQVQARTYLDTAAATAARIRSEKGYAVTGDAAWRQQLGHTLERVQAAGHDPSRVNMAAVIESALRAEHEANVAAYKNYQDQQALAAAGGPVSMVPGGGGYPAVEPKEFKSLKEAREAMMVSARARAAAGF